MTISRTNQNTDCIQTLQEQLHAALAKTDDLENHSRHYNFRIRGLSESVKDTSTAVHTFLKELLLDLPK